MASLDIALNYIGRGWNPVPVKFRSKKPSAGEGWQHLRINADNVAQYFNGVEQNIGIQMSTFETRFMNYYYYWTG